MSIFESFIRGSDAGRKFADRQRKDSALLNASAIYASGAGDAGQPLREVGEFDAANDYDAKAKETKTQQFKTNLGTQINAGNLEGAQTTAFESGELDIGQQIQEMRTNLNSEQQKRVSETFGWLAQNLVSLKTVAPNMRLQAAKDLLMRAGLGDDPEVFAALEGDNADGVITDEELEQSRMTALTVSQQLAQERTGRQDNETRRHHIGMENRPTGGGSGDEDDDFPDEVLP